MTALSIETLRARMEWLLNAGLDPASIPPRELRRHRVLSGSLLLMTLVGTPFIPFYDFVLWAPVTATTTIVAIAGTLLTDLWFRRTHRLVLTGHIMTGLFTFALIAPIIETGGLRTASFGWVLIIPLFSALLTGLRASIAWAGVSALILLLTTLGHVLGLVPPTFPGDDFLIQTGAATFGALVAICVIAYVFLSQVQTAERQMADVIDALKEEVSQRSAAEASAKDALEVRSRFLAMMSHEIRAPRCTGCWG